ncbi:MAG: ATP-binding protein [Planctomycetaceae bacterium]
MSIARLLVLQGVDRGRRYEVGEPPIVIGRGARSDIRIHDTEVSRHHAELQQNEEAWELVDTGSSNGTFLNGVAIDRHRLSSGDQIQVGRTVLLFEQDVAAETQPFRPAVDLTHDLGDASQIIAQIDPETGRQLSDQMASGIIHPRSVVSIQAFNRITEAVVKPFVSLDQLLQRILDVTIHAVGADRGCMFVADAETDELTPRVVGYRDGMPAADRMPVSRTIVEYVVQHAQGVRTSDASHDARFVSGQSILHSGIREAMCVPMQGRYELLGVIYVDTTTSNDTFLREGARHTFSEELLGLLVAVGRQSALAVENNRYQQALVSAERLAAVGQTVASIGHDVKNILQGLRGGSYLIDLGLKKSDDALVRKGWDIVERNQDRIYHLVMDMLSFSKDRRPQLEPANLNQTVQEVVELMQGRAEEEKVKIVYEPATDLPESAFDATGIHRAVLNIVTNAFDALEGIEQPVVTIRTAYVSASDELMVSVTDNGPGISEAELPRLFNVFESTKGSAGTGLGLAVSRKTLREHGGDIQVQSTEGHGAEFRLVWPFHAPSDCEPESVPLDRPTTL